MSGLAAYLAGAVILVGSLFALVAALGVLRLPDLYTRMHAASKAGTVGSSLMLLALAIVAGEIGVATRALAGIAFLLLTAPIAAHLLARAAYLAGSRPWEGTAIDEFKAVAREREEEA